MCPLDKEALMTLLYLEYQMTKFRTLTLFYNSLSWLNNIMDTFQ